MPRGKSCVFGIGMDSFLYQQLTVVPSCCNDYFLEKVLCMYQIEALNTLNLKASRCFKHGSFFSSKGSSAVLLWTTNPNSLFFFTHYHLLFKQLQLSHPFLNKKIQGLFKDTFPIFQGLHSVPKRALSLCLF